MRSDSNTYVHPRTGERFCRTCRNVHGARIRREIREGVRA